MNILSVQNLEKTVKDEPLFTGLTFGVEKGEKVGVVGKNGAGKSTLLRLINGDIWPDEGQISRNNDIKISFLTQNTEFTEGMTVSDYFYASPFEEVKILHEYNEALMEGDTKKYTRLLEKIEKEDLWGNERRYLALIDEFETGVTEDRLMSTLSGGQLKKVAIARALCFNAGLLLLDEPTNHLDIKTIEKLEQKLLETESSVIIVTHDRHILNTVCSTIFELDRASFYRHPGNFSSYLERREERIAFAQKEQDRLRTILRRELEWLKRGPQARTGKDKNRKDRIAEMQERQRNVQDIRQTSFTSQARRLGKKILELEGITKSYNGRTLFSPFDFSFVKGMRIGIVGDNGTGKSTLLDIMTGFTEPDSGKVDVGVNTYYGYYDQRGRDLRSTKTVLEYISDIGEHIDMGGGEIVSASRFLEMFGFPSSMHRSPIGILSGGERRRLYLISRFASNPNFLILDEPTNDLDLPTMENLEEYCSSFPGCMVICSHDRTFLDITTDMLFVIHDGRIEVFPGPYSAWKEEEALRLEEEKEEERKKQEIADSVQMQKNRKKKGLSFKEQKEYETLEKEIEALENEIIELEESFSSIDPADYAAMNRANERYAEAEKLLDEKSTRYLELDELKN